MYILFFLVWVIFNGKITLEITLFGLVISAAVYAFVCRFMGWSPAKDRYLVKISIQVCQYAWLLILEIVKANMATIRMIAAPAIEPDPVIVKFRTRLKSQTAKVVLANSITLTPGTITVSLEEDELTVHCLDRSFSDGLEDSSFEQALLKMEEGREKKG